MLEGCDLIVCVGDVTAVGEIGDIIRIGLD